MDDTPSGLLNVAQKRWAQLPAGARSALLRSDVYRALGWAFLYPDAKVLDSVSETHALIVLRSRDLPSHAATIAALDGLQHLNASTPQPLNEQFDRIFGHTISAECPPYETQYGEGIIFAQAQRLGDIAAFYRAFGVDVSPDARERPDHIAAELEFMSTLAFREAASVIESEAQRVAAVRDAERSFLVEHLASWALSFAERLQRKACDAVRPDGGRYASLARCLAAFVRDELAHAGITAEALGTLELARCDFEPEGCSFACGSGGEPVLANLPGFQV